MTAATVVVESARFAYKAPVFTGLSLAIGPGEAVAVLGRNGAGKTTLLRMLAGELAPSEGRVRIGGGDPRRASVRKGIGFIGEHPAAPGFLSASEYLTYVANLHGLAPKRDAVAAALAATGVGTLGDVRVANMSKGQVRRVELAALVLVDPPVWILDEADSGLDPGGGRVFLAVLEAARARGRCLVVATHVVGHALRSSTKILLLEGPDARFEGTRDALAARVGARALVHRGTEAAADLVARAAAAGLTVEDGGIPEDALEAWLYPDAPTPGGDRR